ncbi:MAG: hypothetical protein WBV39_05760, partial [Rudaea sp.]
PPGLLMLGASAVFAASSAGWRSLLRIFRWDGLTLFALAGGAWFVAVVHRQPGLLHYFLVDEVVDRVASTKFHRNGQWYGAFRIYLPVLIVGSLPWLAIAASRIWKNRASMLQKIRESDESRLIACWIGLPVLVFAFSRSRLPLYILPLFAPIALALARTIQPLALNSISRQVALAAWCFIIVLARIVPGHLTVTNDDKRLAQDLRKHLPAIPGEILFVETAPRFGLRFYLGAEVERLDLPGESHQPESEDIASEMRTSEGCRILLTKPHDANRLADSLNTNKVDFRRLADVRGYAVFLERSADCQAYGNLSQAGAISSNTR